MRENGSFVKGHIVSSKVSKLELARCTNKRVVFLKIYVMIGEENITPLND